MAAGDVTPFLAAVMADVPAATAVARPLEAIVAFVVSAECQVTLVVRFRVLPSE